MTKLDPKTKYVGQQGIRSQNVVVVGFILMHVTRKLVILGGCLFVADIPSLERPYRDTTFLLQTFQFSLPSCCDLLLSFSLARKFEYESVKNRPQRKTFILVVKLFII